MSKFLVLDIETVIDGSVWKPPADKPDDFGPPGAHRIVTIGVLVAEHDLDGLIKPVSLTASSGPEGDQLIRLQTFCEREEPVLVTWNGRGFDMPVIMARSMVWNVVQGWYFKDTNYRYRYKTDKHCDLMDTLADYGATRKMSLDVAAKMLGLPGKGATSGGDVETLWKDGKEQEIRDYCMTDVVQTALVWLAWRNLIGNSRDYIRERKRMAEFISKHESGPVKALAEHLHDCKCK